MASWTDQDLRQLESHGIPFLEADRQISLLTFPPAPPLLDRPATLGDGIQRLSPPEQTEALGLFESRRLEGCFEKFVPASGAASRMFSGMNKVLREFHVTREELEKRAREGSEESQRLIEFFNRIHLLGFHRELEQALRSAGLDLDHLLRDGKYHKILETLLLEGRLDYSEKPKGLVPFHRCGKESRTPVGEHLIEASRLVKDAAGICRVHFTVSPEHEKAFRRHVLDLKTRWESNLHCRLDIVFSFQKPLTDTLALDVEGKPLRDEQGRLLFRPGGHGALIENLAEARTPFLLIKNIDNVAVESRSSPALYWEKVLGGILIRRKEQADLWLRECQAQDFSTKRVETISGEIREEWRSEIPLPPDGAGHLRENLRSFLDRPLRVCGVVPNVGEPGGGPFWVRSQDGVRSLQIVEGSQVDSGNPAQMGLFRSSTHFNPVDMSCALRDFTGKPFDLNCFVDPQTVFLSRKSWQGREIRALERPGLWNGAMAGWITFFVEMPLETFHPVKTVYDLLKPSHQA